jgi:hypothetical protein
VHAVASKRYEYLPYERTEKKLSTLGPIQQWNNINMQAQKENQEEHS